MRYIIETRLQKKHNVLQYLRILIIYVMNLTKLRIIATLWGGSKHFDAINLVTVCCIGASEAAHLFYVQEMVHSL